MKTKSISREEAENKEGLETIKQEVPANRLQEDQQVQDTDAALKTKGANSSFAPKKSKSKGTTLKQQVISDAITGSSSAAGMGINAAGRGVSGTNGGVLGANNSTPQADKSRGASRVGKKLDRVATKLNYTPSEQAIVAVDESKPLADSADQDQGYNGTYRNENARAQKIMGAVPADLMFERSVDLILKDKLYFVEGQQVFQNDSDRTANDPSVTVNPITGELIDTEIKAGNYLHRNFHFGLQSDGSVNYFYADVDDITHGAVSEQDANCASAHRLIKQNVAELDRMAMDAAAGDEKADIWSPLGRAIQQPTKASFLMSSIEADTGAYVYLAYSKATTNMAYQLNRGPKDGLSVVIPAMEQFLGWRADVDNSLSFVDTTPDAAGYTRKDLGALFNYENYRAGDPSLMIAAYDSVAKYNNKADLLLQPRGWRMHLQTADNNLNPLKVPAEFANVYASTECFGTIDHEYDPLLPICMTDKANIITVHNLNELAAFYKEGGYKDAKVTLTYTNLASQHNTVDVVLCKQGVAQKMGWPAIFVYAYQSAGDGINWTEATGILDVDPDNTNRTKALNHVLISPVALDITTASSPYYGYTKKAELAVNYAHDIVFKCPVVQTDVTLAKLEVNELENNWHYYKAPHYCYKYADLRNNYIVEVKHPLIQGIIDYLENAIGAKFYSLLNPSKDASGNSVTAVPEINIPLVFSTQYMTLAQLIICAATPFIARVRMNSMRDVLYYEDNVHSYPYSKLNSLKDVPFKNYVNLGYTDYDSPLETKIINPVQAINWTMPEFFWKVGTRKFVLPWYFCENDLNSDGSVDDDANTMCMPSIRSGFRLAQLDNFYGMTEKDIRLSIDRMTKTFLKDDDVDSYSAYKYGRNTDGQIRSYLKSTKVYSVQKILSAPRELGLSMDAPLGVLTRDPLDGSGAFTSVFKAMSADGTATSFRIKLWTNVNTLQHPSILNDRGVNIDRAANYSQKWFEIFANAATSDTELTGLVFAMGDDAASYSPFADLGTGAASSDTTTVISYQRSLYTRLQLLPFVISPFDSAFTGTYPYDIYDFAYFFGLCGFRASDYRESTYNREKEAVNQGLTFVTDPWVEASPIIKGGQTSTGVHIARGYELK